MPDWTLLEPPPEPIQKKKGILFLNPEDMLEAKRSMKEKGIKIEDIKKLPPLVPLRAIQTIFNPFP